MDQEVVLLQALHASPDDDLAWLALADHLEEQGQPQRGELLRLSVALHADPFGPEAAARAVRVQALLASGVRPCVPVVTNSIGMPFALIRAGKFLMGSPADEDGRSDNEGPQHEVEITRPFYLGVFPVTQEQYQKVMGANPSWFSRSGEGKNKVRNQDTGNFPVENISSDDAIAFGNNLSQIPEEKRANRRYTLPAEAQWEYACRGGAPSSPFHFGASLSSMQANFNGNYPHGGAAKGPYLERPCPVGSYPPNAFGLFDMHGNVWEWCADFYDENYYLNSPRKDPTGPTTGTSRVLRGGSWYLIAQDCRAAYRNDFDPGFRYFSIGLRVVLSA